MKNFTTLIATLLLAVGSLSAQLVLVNSPEEVAGSYDFGQTDLTWGADLLTDSWTGDVEFVDDGVEVNTNGCETITNDLSGKIALVDRGACSFSLKAFNAQKAGAIAVVIFNDDRVPGGLVTMSPTPADSSAAVTIPVVFLVYEDGQAIRSALENGPVNMTIGSPQFDNNVTLGATSIINAPLGIVPLSQVGEGNFVLNPGAIVANNGLNAASDVTLSAVIQHNSFDGEITEVYNETATIAEMIEPDTTSALQVLPAFEPTSGAGQYTVNYSASLEAPDGLPFDNIFSSTFTVSENLYSKASWDPSTGNPRTTTRFRSSASTMIEFLTLLNIPNGEGAVIDSVLFSISTGDESLAGIDLESYVYEWNDLNEDSTVTNDEIEIVGIALFTFPEDETETVALVRLPFLDVLTFEENGVAITENDKNYIIGVRYQGEGSVFLGFDDTYDYTQYLDYKTANGTLSDIDYGYLGVTQWTEDSEPDMASAFIFGSGSGGLASSTGVILSGLPSSTEEVVGEEVFRMDIFPNPATDQITTRLQFEEKTSFVEYRITDVNGRLIFNQRDMDVFEKEQANFNVKQLPAGQYFMTIRTDQGIQSKPFVIKR